MQKTFYILFFLLFTSLQMFGSSSDLSKKTLKGLIVPFVLRYEPEEWDLSSNNGVYKFYFQKDSSLQVRITSNDEEKNLDMNSLSEGIRKSLIKKCSDPTQFEGYEIKCEKMVSINGINFLYHSILLDLAPNSVHIVPLGPKGQFRQKRITENGTQDQIDIYSYSGKEGRVTFCFESESRLISEEKQAAIAELFRGFSFDGSACRGPEKLRGLKSLFEALTDK